MPILHDPPADPCPDPYCRWCRHVNGEVREVPLEIGTTTRVLFTATPFGVMETPSEKDGTR